LPSEIKSLPAGSIKLDEVTISSQVTGKSLNIRPLVREFSIFENIMQPFINGQVVVGDALALSSWFPLTGQETIRFKFSTPHVLFKKGIDVTMQIVSVENLTPVNVRTEMFIINCVSQESILDWNTMIRQSYREIPISEMVEKIAKQYLHIEGLEKVAETDGNRTVVIPNMHPTRALRFLSSEAKSTKYPPSNFVFYQTCDGYYFQTVDELISIVDSDRLSDIGDFYYMSDKDMGTPMTPGDPSPMDMQGDKPQEFLKIISVEFPTLFDMRKMSKTGGFESTLRTIDPLMSLYQEKTYDYFVDYEKFRRTTTDSQTSAVGSQGQVLSTFSQYVKDGESRIDFIMDNAQSSDSPDQKAEFLLLQNASFAMLDNLVVNVTIPGDSTKRIGDVVYLQFPEFGGTNDVLGKVHKYVSGQYLVVACRHIYNNKGYKTAMRCAKNSYQSRIESADRLDNLPIPDSQSLIVNQALITV
jgi:hypothetical protein